MFDFYRIYILTVYTIWNLDGFFLTNF